MLDNFDALFFLDYLLLNNLFFGLLPFQYFGFELDSLLTGFRSFALSLYFKFYLFLDSLLLNTLIRNLLGMPESFNLLLFSCLSILLYLLQVLLLLGRLLSLLLQLNFSHPFHLLELNLIQLDLVLDSISLVLQSCLSLNGTFS